MNFPVFMLRWRRYAPWLLLLLLSACSTPDYEYVPAPAVSLREAPPGWEQHQASVSAIDAWLLRGRLNVRQSTASDTVNLNWEQRARAFDIRLSGALGLGAIVVQGDDAGVKVEQAGEDPVYLRDLSELSQTYLGFEFPAANLFYWVRGLPAPDLPATASWNAEGQLATLEQSDRASRRWRLTFDRYDASQSPALPGRIRLEQADLRLTFLIDGWQFTPPSAVLPNNTWQLAPPP
jgi:outer membrane lipoprotein LolB